MGGCIYDNLNINSCRVLELKVLFHVKINVFDFDWNDNSK